MPVTVCPPAQVADEAARLEATGQTITTVYQLHDGRVVLVSYPRGSTHPAGVEHRTLNNILR